jgi:hypothetical protein
MQGLDVERHRIVRSTKAPGPLQNKIGAQQRITQSALRPISLYLYSSYVPKYGLRPRALFPAIPAAAGADAAGDGMRIDGTGPLAPK